MSINIQYMKDNNSWGKVSKSSYSELSCYSKGLYYLTDQDRFVIPRTGSTRDTMYDLEIESVSFERAMQILNKENN